MGVACSVQGIIQWAEVDGAHADVRDLALAEQTHHAQGHLRIEHEVLACMWVWLVRVHPEAHFAHTLQAALLLLNVAQGAQASSGRSGVSSSRAGEGVAGGTPGAGRGTSRDC